jgi:hypothetical protein
MNITYMPMRIIFVELIEAKDCRLVEINPKSI